MNTNEIIKTGKNSLIMSKCPQCGNERYVRTNRIGVICNNCRISNIKTNRGKNWKGGLYISRKGYVFIYKPDHPNSHKSGYIKRSHLVMEKKLRRLINNDEDVHHINGITSDDSPENLALLTHKDHTILTNRQLNKSVRMLKARWPNGR